MIKRSVLYLSICSEKYGKVISVWCGTYYKSNKLLLSISEHKVRSSSVTFKRTMKVDLGRYTLTLTYRNKSHLIK